MSDRDPVDDALADVQRAIKSLRYARRPDVRNGPSPPPHLERSMEYLRGFSVADLAFDQGVSETMARRAIKGAINDGLVEATDRRGEYHWIA